MTLPFKVINPTAQLPTRGHPTDAGLDLYSVDRVTLKPGQRKIVDTGLAVALPENTAGFVTPRSGLAAKFGITVVNAPGIIDVSYRGSLKVVLLNTGDKDFNVAPGDRIAQLLVVPVLLMDAVEVEDLDETERGEGGFGSTGS